MLHPAAGSSLACFGVNGSATRLYYLDLATRVNELAWENGHWENTDAYATAAAPGSSLTCFGVNGSATRLYYLDPASHVNELAWVDGYWVNTPITATAAAPGSSLTCFGVNGSATRLYYLDPASHVNELAWVDGGWVNTPITATAAAPGSSLTCFGANGSAMRLFYLDLASHVNELAWVGHWVNTDMTAAAGAPSAAPGSSLTCFGVGGSATRLYYLDPASHVNELAWIDGDLVNTDITKAAYASSPPIPGIMPAPGSSLTCFGVGGSATRLYYLDTELHVNELAWVDGHWVNTDITSVAVTYPSPTPGSEPALGSSLTCFGVNGSATRLYYIDSNVHLNELAWENSGWLLTTIY